MEVRSMLTLMLLLLLVLPAPVRAAAERLTVFTPPPASLVESPRVSVVVRAEKSAVDTVEIAVGKERKGLAPSTVAMSVLHFEGIELARGMNTITITGFTKGRVVEEKELQVFFRSDLSPDNSPPAGFDRYFFHAAAQERACSQCHQVNFEGIARMPEKPQKSPCFSCHRRITERRFVHGPAAVWSCSACHNTGGKGKKNGVVQPDEKACSACHDDAIAAWKAMPFGHGPTAMGNCVTCHNPHGSDQPFFLQRHAGDLCLSCHVDVASRPHLVSSTSGSGGHPLRVSPDPFRPGRDFSCASCHNPHAGTTASLLNNFQGSKSKFCMGCHEL